MKTYRSWINIIPFEEASGRLKAIYERIRGPKNYIDNIMLVHSLRPHTLEGHMALYKHVLHHARNTLPSWLLEATGVYVSLLNGCDYCVEHHYHGMKRILTDEIRAGAIRQALENGTPEDIFSRA